MMASNEEGDLILFCGGFLYTDKESKKGNLEEKTSDWNPYLTQFHFVFRSRSLWKMLYFGFVK